MIASPSHDEDACAPADNGDLPFDRKCGQWLEIGSVARGDLLVVSADIDLFGSVTSAA